jgi:hypothetical protein
MVPWSDGDEIQKDAKQYLKLNLKLKKINFKIKKDA